MTGRSAKHIASRETSITTLFHLNHRINPRDNHVNRNRVEAAFGDDHVGVALAWFDEFQVHRAHGLQILLHHRFPRAAALRDIALQTTDKAQVRIGIHENFDVEHLAQRTVYENQNSFREYNRARFDGPRLGFADVPRKIVHRQFDRLSSAQRFQMLDHQVGLEGVGMIVVDPHALFKRQIAAIAIVRIVLNVGDAIATNAFKDRLRYGCLA